MAIITTLVYKYINGLQPQFIAIYAIILLYASIFVMFCCCCCCCVTLFAAGWQVLLFFSYFKSKIINVDENKMEMTDGRWWLNTSTQINNKIPYSCEHKSSSSFHLRHLLIYRIKCNFNVNLRLSVACAIDFMVCRLIQFCCKYQKELRWQSENLIDLCVV